MQARIHKAFEKWISMHLLSYFLSFSFQPKKSIFMQTFHDRFCSDFFWEHIWTFATVNWVSMEFLLNEAKIPCTWKAVFLGKKVSRNLSKLGNLLTQRTRGGHTKWPHHAHSISFSNCNDFRERDFVAVADTGILLYNTNSFFWHFEGGKLLQWTSESLYARKIWQFKVRFVMKCW